MKTNMSLHAAVHTYLDALAAAGTPQGTVKMYRSVLLRLVKAFPDAQFKGVTTQRLAGFLYGPDGISVGKAPNTSSTQRSALRSLWAYGELMGWGRRIHVPSPVIRQRKASGASSSPPTRLSAPQLSIILAAAGESSPILRAMLAVAMNTALRISDIMKIEMGHIDLAAGELHVWIKKTGRFDTLPITADLDGELRRYLTWYTAESGVTFASQGAYAFPGWRVASATQRSFTHAVEPSRHASYTWSRDRLVKLYRQCGIGVEKREAWHVIRRSVARIYFDGLREDVSHDHALRQTAALLGHANVATTEVYLGMQAEVQARNESLRGKPFLSRPEFQLTDSVIGL